MSSSMKEQLENNEIVAKKADRYVKDLVKDIDHGYQLQDINLQDINEMENKNTLDFVDSIILKPPYQRDYRYSGKEESSLIESMLLGIPIPPVYMVSTKINSIPAFDVVDGQHRLTAIYRFLTDEFTLSGLSILTEYNGKKFKDLVVEQQSKLYNFELSTYQFTKYPTEQVEIEIFRRYNQGTKPLTSQEIRTAVYRSPISDWVNHFIKTIYSNPSTEDEKRLCSAYNVTDDRLRKKKVHESVFAILYIIENGFNKKFKNSTSYSEEYMKQKFSEFSGENISIEDNLNKTIALFTDFNNWILCLTKRKDYPFSKEIYGISSRNYKFQMSIAMLLSGIFHKYKGDVSILKSDDFFNYMTEQLRDSYLENPDYNASSTNSDALIKFLEDFNY